MIVAAGAMHARLLVWLAALAIAVALALLPLPLVVLALGVVLAVGLALIEPIFGVYWALCAVSAQSQVLLPGGLSLTEAAVLLTAGAWGLRVLAYPERRVHFGGMLPLWAFLLWWLLLAALLSPYAAQEGIREVARWAAAFVIWLVAVNSVERPWQAYGLVAAVLLAPAANGLIGLVQFATGAGPPSFRIAEGQIFVRAHGTLGQPNSFAGYMNTAWPLALALALVVSADCWRARHTRHPGALALAGATAALWLTTATLLAALVASFSRGAWVGAVCGAAALALALGRRHMRGIVAAVALGALGAAVALALGALPAAVGARLASIWRNIGFFDASAVVVTPENYAVVERMAQIQAGWRMVLAHPITGVGPGSYTHAYGTFAVPPWYMSRGHAHNYYLHMAAEAGTIGLLAYLGLVAAVAVQAVATVRRTNRTFWHGVGAGCCGMIAAVAGHNLFENLHVLHIGIQIAAIWSLATLGATNAPAQPGVRSAREALFEHNRFSQPGDSWLTSTGERNTQRHDQ